MLHSTIHPYLPPELLNGFVDTPTILLILLLGHICKQWLGGEKYFHLQTTFFLQRFFLLKVLLRYNGCVCQYKCSRTAAGREH